MTYLITAKGTKSDIGTNESYTELGWMLLVSRLAYIRDLYNKKWKSDDVVVTLSDRKFLFTNLAKTVISFEELTGSEDVYDYTYEDKICSLDDLEDLHGLYMQGKIDHYKYINHKDMILNINYSNVVEKYNIVNERFAGVLLRIRNWCPERNLEDQLYISIIQELKKRYNKVFVFGLNSKRIWKDFDVTYLDNLQDWASIINHPLCDVIVGTPSGALAIGQVCGNSNFLLVTSDPQMCQRHPLYFSAGVNFGDIKISITPTIEDIKNKLNEICRL